jgi:hemolysin activation/secretion protein
VRTLNFVRRALLAALGCWCLPLAAQVAPGAVQIPPGATPGGALPHLEQAVPPVPRQGELFEVPRVYDRPLGLEEGPRILVKTFKLQGAVDHRKHHVRVAAAQALLEAAREQQPAQGFSINQLQQVADKVAAYYREHGYILAQAFIPAQKVVDGEVAVQVLEGKLSGVTVEGNKHYPVSTLSRPFESLLNEPLDKDSIEAALLTLTNYPGLTAFGVLGAGHDVGTTNLTIRVQSEDRVHLESVTDNYGTQYAGEYREQVTLTLEDPLHWADRLKLTGLYANSFNGSAHGAYGGLDYDIPIFSPNDSLHVQHVTNAYDVGATAAVATAKSTGQSRVDELGYRHDFARTRLSSASIGLAFNVKSATFDAPPTVLYDDKLTTARLDAQWEGVDTKFRGVDRVAFSYTHGFNNLLGALGAYDPSTATDSRASRLGASGEFNKFTLEMQRLQRITEYTSLILRVDGQYSKDPLVSLEQFSMGGPDSVRAYSVAEVLAETGGVATLELSTGLPGLSNRHAFGNSTWGQALQFSTFVDYADGRLNAPVSSTQEAVTHLAGAGGSIQFNVPGRLFARLDLATPLTSRKPSDGRWLQYYFRVGTTFL